MKEANDKNYALSLLNKEKMKLVKSISYWKKEVIHQEKWIENFKVEVKKLPAEEQKNKYVSESLEGGIEFLSQYRGILKEEKRQLMSINNAIAILKKFGEKWHYKQKGE